MSKLQSKVKESNVEQPSRWRTLTCLYLTGLLLPISGCATTSPETAGHASVSSDTAGYDSVGSASDHHSSGYETSAIEVRHGEPNRAIDGLGWVLGIPSKVALWDRRADNHNISLRTEEQVVGYLDERGLDSTLVRVNQYDPVGEWNRLAANRDVGLGWRLTGGTIETLKYTLLPGRVIGEDWYNPFTNTVNLYSDIPSIGLAEAAYAHDVSQRQFPGAYATSQIVPIVGMWHETLATREALQFTLDHGTEKEQEEAYRILYPSYGGKWGGGLASFVPFGQAYGRLAGAAAGHAANGVRKLTDRDPAARVQ